MSQNDNHSFKARKNYLTQLKTQVKKDETLSLEQVQKLAVSTQLEKEGLGMTIAEIDSEINDIIGMNIIYYKLITNFTNILNIEKAEDSDYNPEREYGLIIDHSEYLDGNEEQKVNNITDNNHKEESKEKHSSVADNKSSLVASQSYSEGSHGIYIDEEDYSEYTCKNF